METNDQIVVTVRDNFIYSTRRFMQRIAYYVLGPKIMSKVYYRIVMKSKLHLKNPVTFNEKINWYKLYYCPKDPLIISCSDKYTVREYLIQKGLDAHLAELVGVWDDPNEIQWDLLPERFALKNSNGCGYNIICRNKALLDEKTEKKRLKKWLKDKFGCYNAEPHYNIGPKKIICETYIDSGSRLPDDYKIHCMNGVAKVIQVCDERTSKTTRYTYFDTDGAPLCYGKSPSSTPIQVSQALLAEMVRISNLVAVDFPYVRVDFFINKDHLQISELTFTPSAGLKPDLIYGGGDVEMGKMLDMEGMVSKYGKKDSVCGRDHR